MNGWISLHRKIRQSWIWQKPEYAQAFMDVLMLVNHAPAQVLVNGKVIFLSRGQSCRSIESWVNEFGGSWTRQKCRTFFSLLEGSLIINQSTTSRTTILTVCNYSTYQNPQPTLEKNLTNPQPTDNQSITTNNKDNKKNKKKKEAAGAAVNVISPENLPPPPPRWQWICAQVIMPEECDRLAVREMADQAPPKFFKQAIYALRKTLDRNPYPSELRKELTAIIAKDRDARKSP